MGKLSLYARSRVVSLSMEANLSVIAVTRILAKKGIKVSCMSVSRFLKCYCASGSLHDAPRSGRKCKLSEEQLTFIDEKMKENDELTSEELMKMLASQFGVEVSSSAIRRVRHEKLGWKYENTRYCQFFREPNKIKRLAFCLNALSRKDSFDDVIFTDETTAQIEQYARASFRKDGTQAKRKGRPKHPLKV